MVLASYLKQKWEAERNQQFLDERRRNKASMRKWAEKRGIPIDELPERGTISWQFGEGYRMGYGEGYKQGIQEGIRLERQRLEKTTIQSWAKERDIPVEELPDVFR